MFVYLLSVATPQYLAFRFTTASPPPPPPLFCSILNQHLQSLMPGLTAKVFRTYNASETLQNQLPGEEALAGLSVAEKVRHMTFLRASNG